jgi:hypothetical protein
MEVHSHRLDPLKFTSSECKQRWMTWSRCLMGFCASPYNAVKMYLVAEEILKGDRNDPSNAFQYDYVHLNLPGLHNHMPSCSCSWISKQWHGGSLASDFVCFIDDQHVIGEGVSKIVEAGPASPIWACRIL